MTFSPHDFSKLSDDTFKQLVHDLVGNKAITVGGASIASLSQALKSTSPRDCLARMFRTPDHTSQPKVTKDLRDYVRSQVASVYPFGKSEVKLNLLILGDYPLPDRDKQQLLITLESDSRVESVTLWSRDDLTRMLSGSAEVRRKYRGYMTRDNVFEHMEDAHVGFTNDLIAPFRSYTLEKLVWDQWAKLGRNAIDADDKMPLNLVGIDLGLTDQSNGAVATLVASSDSRLLERPRHSIVVGDPGQGKSTITQLLCQFYRSQMLVDDAALIPARASLLLETRSAFAAMGLTQASCSRFPFHVELATFSRYLQEDAQHSLKRFLAADVSKHSDTDVKPSDVSKWIKNWPCLLVLDGLDEVTVESDRTAVMTAIDQFRQSLADDSAEIAIVATTRPQGYLEEFDESEFEKYGLELLNAQRASKLGSGMIKHQHRADPEIREDVLSRFAVAQSRELTATLMKTPLQVTIMTKLLEREARLPTTRYGLFQTYYETIYRRELGKEGATADILATYRPLVDELHEEVAVRLQILPGKSASGGQGVQRSELEEICRARLIADGHDDESEREPLIDRIVGAILNRLVLLIPKGEGEAGFEVRSFQEFMAARWLVSGPDHEILHRLREVCIASSWLNTWLFAAGRLIATRNHLRSEFLDDLTAQDARSPAAHLYRPSTYLSAHLVNDSFDYNTPATQRALAQNLLAVFDTALSDEGALVAAAMARSARLGPSDLVVKFRSAIKNAAQSNIRNQVTAYALASYMRQYNGPMSTVLGDSPELGGNEQLRSSLSLHYTQPVAFRRPQPRKANRVELRQFLRSKAEQFDAAPHVEFTNSQLLSVFEGAVTTICHQVNNSVVVSEVNFHDIDSLISNLIELDAFDEFRDFCLELAPDDWSVAAYMSLAARSWSERKLITIQSLRSQS